MKFRPSGLQDKDGLSVKVLSVDISVPSLGCQIETPPGPATANRSPIGLQDKTLTPPS